MEKKRYERPENEKTKAGMHTELEGRKNLLVSFGGGKGGLGVPVYEFYNSIAHLECDKIFVRDFKQEYYQKGTGGEIDHIDKLVKFFQDTVEKGNYEKVCCIGNSMGGYASILFGSLMNADRAIAFAPQTFIDWWTKIRYRDFRATRGHTSINFWPKKQKKYFNLRKHLNRLDNYKTDIRIYYDVNYQLDVYHIAPMAECRNVTIVEMQEGGHEVVKVLKEQGELKRLIEGVFQ